MIGSSPKKLEGPKSLRTYFPGVCAGKSRRMEATAIPGTEDFEIIYMCIYDYSAFVSGEWGGRWGRKHLLAQ